jgi:hypothetical protein
MTPQGAIFVAAIVFGIGMAAWTEFKEWRRKKADPVKYAIEQSHWEYKT